MRRTILTTSIACVALAFAGPALAQGHGGGPGGGQGAGPPMTPPGQSGGGFGTSNAARDIADQRGQFGRDFAQQQHLTAAQYQAQAQQHRADALALAQAARNGDRIPASAAGRIRTALADDIDAWRDQFKVDRSNWQAMRDQWLVNRGSLTPQQWAEQRAAWFQARDAWIANQKSWAQARRH